LYDATYIIYVSHLAKYDSQRARTPLPARLTASHQQLINCMCKLWRKWKMKRWLYIIFLA